MNLDDRGLFRELEPPPGGPERFRRRLEDRNDALRSPLGRYLIAGVMLSLLAIAVIGTLKRADDTEPQVANLYEAREFDRLLGRPIERADLSVSVDDEPVSVSETPSADSKIRIYQIVRD